MWYVKGKDGISELLGVPLDEVFEKIAKFSRAP